MRICSINECHTPVGNHGARGYCPKHYKRFVKHGDPTRLVFAPPNLGAEESLAFKGWTVTPNGCWEWNGLRDKDGYGRLIHLGKRALAHRLAYETWNGLIEQGLLVRHRCDNPPCINPAHLITGTPKQNTDDATARDRMARDEWHGQCKLDSRSVLLMKAQYSTGNYSQRQLASMHGISQAQVNNILLNKQRQRAAIPHAAMNTAAIA